MTKYDLVDKGCYETDPYNAPYETIYADSPGKAKSEYHRRYPEYPYTDIICRKHKIGSFNIPSYLINI